MCQCTSTCMTSTQLIMQHNIENEFVECVAGHKEILLNGGLTLNLSSGWPNILGGGVWEYASPGNFFLCSEINSGVF